jgi:hypothetical protein
MIPSFSCTILLDESQAAIMFLPLQKTKNIGKNEQCADYAENLEIACPPPYICIEQRNQDV